MKAELYDLAGNKLAETWVKHLPTGQAVIGFSKQDVERQAAALTYQISKE